METCKVPPNSRFPSALLCCAAMLLILFCYSDAAFPQQWAQRRSIPGGVYLCLHHIENQFVAAKNAMASARSGPATPLITGDSPRGPLRPIVIDMVATHKPDNGPPVPPIIFHDVLENLTWHGHKATRRTTATTKPGGTDFVFWATVIFDAKTLLPYCSEYRREDGVFVRHEFNGVHVKETRTEKPLRSPPVQPGENWKQYIQSSTFPNPHSHGLRIPVSRSF